MNRRVVSRAAHTRVGLLVVCVCWLAVRQAPLVAAFPKSVGDVNDFAGILDASTRATLESIIRETEQKTSAEIAVATVSSLDGMTVEQYANKLFHEWGIGKKDKDNGVLVLVAPGERKVRIEVGYGLEPVIPDGLAGEIVRTAILPKFRSNDYPGGVVDGVRQVAAIVQRGHVLTADERRQSTAGSSGDRPPMLLMILFFGVFIACGAFMIGAGLKSRSVFPLLFGSMFGGVPFLMSLVPFFNAPVMILGPLALAMGLVGYRKTRVEAWRMSTASSNPAGRSSGWVMGSSDSSSSDSSSSDSSSSSSSSDSGGSFGGGDSGGGGASGSW